MKRHERKVINSVGHAALRQLRDAAFSSRPRRWMSVREDKLVMTLWGVGRTAKDEVQGESLRNFFSTTLIKIPFKLLNINLKNGNLN